MSLVVPFTVHSCTPELIASEVTLPSNAVVEADVQGLVVEMVSSDGTMSQTYRIIPQNYGLTMEQATSLFTPGASIDVTVAAHSA